ncbi:YhgE/Pip domain-containing protein [Nocardia sp. NPDC051570]|uniref:YhgE/Pip domain-containing protein n=1 Tax=Nocardia sp. NPDC051570 TaxID=3364324 RepID=UPI0037BCC2AF
MTWTTDEDGEDTRPGWDHKLWAIPLIIAMGLLSLLALSYLGSVLHPQRNLHDYPLTLVNNDRGEYGGEVAERVRGALPHDQVRLQVTDAAEADRLMSLGSVYGSIVIPEDFSARLTALAEPGPGPAAPPGIELQTNPRAGATAVTLTTQLLTPVLDGINRQLGTAATERARTGGVPLSDAALVTLAEPVRIEATQHAPLPEGTANGISAFYYTLLVVFAGFTSSTLINVGVDTVLANDQTLSRWRALLFKWALIAVVALVMAGCYQLIASALGMPIDHRLALFCFSTFASLAVGMTALANLAVVATVASALRLPVLNNLGTPINMLAFIALGLPSSGAIMPIQAVPRLYGALAEFEPMHQVYLGVRSILYFDALAAAGLTRALVMCTVGVVFAVVVGVLTTLGYERWQARQAPAEAQD